MNKQIVNLQVNQQQIRIVDGLLMVVGNHGTGKTNFLQNIVNKEYKLVDNYEYEICSLLLTNSTYNEIIDSKLSNVENFEDFVYEFFDIVNKEELLQRISNKEELYSDENKHFLAYRRLIFLQTLLQLNQKFIIVIDEPELFAHPLLVRDICTTLYQLQRKGNVVILATNSETVVSRLFVDIEQIVRLEKNKIVQANAKELVRDIQEFYHQDMYLLRRFSASNQVDIGLNNVLNNYVRTYLSSVFRNQIFNVMHADCIILGEGSSEDVFFDYMDQIICPKWMRYNRVHYMGCLGKSTMPFYFLFLNHLGIRVVSLFDADKDSNLVHLAYKNAFKKYKDENPCCFASMILDPDLEHVLQIVPNYKLQAMEKPINIYYHTFVTNNVSQKVEEIANLIYLLFEDMKDVSK